MKREQLLKFFLREWLLIFTIFSFFMTSIFVGRLPHYSPHEWEVLFVLLTLFVTLKGIQLSGFFSKIAQLIQNKRFLPPKLVVLTFFLSMFLNNDVTLLLIVPMTLSLKLKKVEFLIILEALSANAGSALTPMGNPQNLFIYWTYKIYPLDFIQVMLPFSLLFFFLLTFLAFFISEQKERSFHRADNPMTFKMFYYLFLFFIILLSIFRILPYSFNVIVIFFALLMDKKVLFIDYSLLFIFLFFFGIADNINILFASRIEHHGNIFLATAFSSQLLSNVPATLIFTKFTTQWKALLWGSNVGGFGSLFGSLANLIAYKIYLSEDKNSNNISFTLKFLFWGYLAFFLGLGWYFFLHNING